MEESWRAVKLVLTAVSGVLEEPKMREANVCRL
jgi:hypothetical protein